MTDKPHRYGILNVVIFLYLIPCFFLTILSLNFMPFSKSWLFFCITLLWGIIGSLMLFVLMSRLESTEHIDVIREVEPQHEEKHTKAFEKIEDLQNELLKTRNECDSLRRHQANFKEELNQTIKDKKELQAQIEIGIEELQTYKAAAEEQIQFKEKLLQEAQQIAREQRLLVEKHQQHIFRLENKEKDLHYEIQTLLQLSSLSTPPPETSSDIEDSLYLEAHAYSTPYENASMSHQENAAFQLNRCLDIATRIGGPYYSNGNSTSRSYDNYALDLRRLFDSLRDENNYMVFVYSLKENKLLFINNPVKTILGWTPEKFSQEFPEIIAEAQGAWQNAINQLSVRKETTVSLLMKSKAGQSMSLECHLGAIHTGPLRHHAIGILTT